MDRRGPPPDAPKQAAAPRKASGVQKAIDLDPAENDAPGGAFGRILVERGLATEDDLERCLRIQFDRAKRGDFVRLGAILVEQGLLTPPQVAEILQQQAITVLACDACGAQYNVRRYSPVKDYECRRCHGRLAPPRGKLENVAVQDAVEEAKAPGEKKGDTVVVPQSTTATGKIRQRRSLGRYEILGEIARGGMGVIYKARQLDLERVVALKTLRADEARRDDAMERFRREARAIAVLRHPNIVAVHDVGLVEDIPYFTMEFIEGLPLDRRLIKGPIPAREAVGILAPIAEALHYCHSEGVVHRDLKPANIIVDSHAVPFLVDFGIAVRKAERGPNLDDKDELLGSIPYMAPEYVEGAAYDERCDIYSFGVVLYEVLAGHEQFPYFDRSTTRLLEKIADDAPVPIRERAPELDADLAAIVMKAIARKREDRYATAGAFAADLRTWLAGGPVTANPLTPLQRFGRAVAREAPPVFALVLAGTTILGGGLAISRERARVQAQHEADLLRSEIESTRRRSELETCRALLREARVHEQLGKVDRAIEVLTEVIDGYGSRGAELPAIAEAYDRRGRIRVACRLPGGEEDLARAARLDPRFGKRR